MNINHQNLITFGTLSIAVANVASAIFIYKFTRKTRNLLKNIERHTRVVRTDVLLRRAEQKRLERARKQRSGDVIIDGNGEKS